jgi:hypothetical protein
MTCTETHVKFSKWSGSHGGHCSIQGRLLGLTPWIQDVHPGHHAVTSDSIVSRCGAQCHPTLWATKEAHDVRQARTSCLQTPATAIQLLTSQSDSYLNISGDKNEVWCVPSASHVPCVHWCQCKVSGFSFYYPVSYLLLIIISTLFYSVAGRVDKSVKRLTTGWTVRNRIPVETRFSASPDRLWGPPSLL